MTTRQKERTPAGWTAPFLGPAPAETQRLPAAALGLLAATLAAAADLMLGERVVAMGLLVVGPCMAAVSARPRVVAAVGAYALGLLLLLSWPDHVWLTVRQFVYAVAVVCVSSIGVVVARQRMALEQLTAQSRLHRAALGEAMNASEDAFVSYALDGTITSWNAGAERLYGYAAPEAIGRHASLFMSADEAGEFPDLLRRIGGGEHIQHYEARHRAENGEVVDVSVNLSPITDPADGQVVGAFAVARDITGRVRAEQQRRSLQEATHQAQRLQSLGQLAGGVAHDFNNLLSVISNYAAFIAEATHDKPTVQADVERIQHAAHRAAQLTAQLLTFARREKIQLQAQNLNAVVLDAHRLLTRTLSEQIELLVLPTENLPQVMADRGQLEQAIVNLALNARDAMPDGGTLVIQTRDVELKAELSRLRPVPQPGHYVELSVSDTGEGMTPEVADRIFEPFFTTRPKGQAVGLGLATTYGIITEAGGAFNVYTELGIGTTIRVYLPAVDAPLPRTAEPAPAATGHGETILVVDDQPDLRELIARILTRHGYSVLPADGGRQALTLAEQHRLDLLLTDVVMPTMSGPDLNNRLQKRHPDLPVLFMSGYSDGLLGAQRVLDPGVHLLQKPFTEQALLRGVHAALTPARHGSRA